jgi:DNA-binding PadR family transcriptional regulator
MSLRFALLALLRVGPLSGYDLQKQFSVSVGHVWHAPGSQIYPELRKMEQDGLVVGEEQPRGERGARRLYHVTSEGDAAFQDWMRSPLGYLRVRDPAHLRSAYLESVAPDEARAFLRTHQEQWEAELAQWEAEIARIDAGESPMLQRRLVVTPPAEQRATIAYKRFAYEGLVERARTEIAWARRGLSLVDRLDRDAVG